MVVCILRDGASVARRQLWLPRRRLALDAEGSTVAYRRVVEDRAKRVVKIHSRDSKVGVIELSDKRARERVGTKSVATTLDRDSLLTSWLAIGAGNALSCSRRKACDDDEQVVLRLATLGEQRIDANYSFARSPSDAAESFDDKVEPARTTAVIPLTTAAGSTTDYEFYDPYSHENSTRHVESARVVPTPSDVVEAMKEQAQLHPASPDPEINAKGRVVGCGDELPLLLLKTLPTTRLLLLIRAMKWLSSQLPRTTWKTLKSRALPLTAQLRLSSCPIV